MERFQLPSKAGSYIGGGLGSLAAQDAKREKRYRLSLRETPFTWNGVQYLGWSTMLHSEKKAFFELEGRVL